MCDKGGHPLTAGQADKEQLSWGQDGLSPASTKLGFEPFPIWGEPFDGSSYLPGWLSS